MDNKWALPAALIGGMLVILCCITVVCLGLLGYMVFQPVETVISPTIEIGFITPEVDFPTPSWDEPTPPSLDAGPTPRPPQDILPDLPPVDGELVPTDTLKTLN